MKSVKNEIRHMHAFEPDVRLILPTGCAVDLTRFTILFQIEMMYKTSLSTRV